MVQPSLCLVFWPCRELMSKLSPQPMLRPQRNHHGNRQHKPSWRYLWWPLWLPQSESRHSVPWAALVGLRWKKSRIIIKPSYRPEHPWTDPWEQSKTGERRRPCGSSREQRHLWLSASSRPGGTGSWSVSTGLRRVLSSLQKVWESSPPPQRACCTPC